MSYLDLKGITKTYGQFVALEEVHLGVGKGEFVTFLGPSGSGKTTTLMIIAGFEKATSGTVDIEGRSLHGLAPHQRNIGIVFQNYGLFPHKTAAENVWFPLQMRGMKRGPGLRKAEEMLELVGLKGFGHRYPKELSGGQQQRVALARALVFEPSLLLLDEPLGALDKNLREQMQIEIKRIQRTLGVTTIFVTHDQTEAMSMSDRIVVFEKGRIQQVATPLELYHRSRGRQGNRRAYRRDRICKDGPQSREGQPRHADDPSGAYPPVPRSAQGSPECADEGGHDRQLRRQRAGDRTSRRTVDARAYAWRRRRHHQRRRGVLH